MSYVLFLSHDPSAAKPSHKIVNIHTSAGSIMWELTGVRRTVSRQQRPAVQTLLLADVPLRCGDVI